MLRNSKVVGLPPVGAVPHTESASTLPHPTGTQPAAGGAGGQNASLVSWRGQETDIWMGGTTRIQSVEIGGIWIHWHTEDFIHSCFHMFVFFVLALPFPKFCHSML